MHGSSRAKRSRLMVSRARSAHGGLKKPVARQASTFNGRAKAALLALAPMTSLGKHQNGDMCEGQDPDGGQRLPVTAAPVFANGGSAVKPSSRPQRACVPARARYLTFRVLRGRLAGGFHAASGRAVVPGVRRCGQRVSDQKRAVAPRAPSVASEPPARHSCSDVAGYVRGSLRGPALVVGWSRRASNRVCARARRRSCVAVDDLGSASTCRRIRPPSLGAAKKSRAAQPRRHHGFAPARDGSGPATLGKP